MSICRPATCPVCEAVTDGQLVERLTDRRKGIPGSWELVRCGNCSTVFMEPMPSDSELGAYYDAYTKEDKVVVGGGTGSRRPGLRRVYHRLSGDVDPRDFVEIPAAARALDYGSGGGTYLSYFSSRGADIVGAEISDTMVSACTAAGLNVRRVDDFDAIPFPDCEFDVVYLMQVFEHLREPRSFMGELARILKPGGTLHLALPNASSGWRRIFGRHWVSGWFAPFHLAHYTKESLTRLGAEFGLVATSSWSRTPESWFRLNLKAALHPESNEVESVKSVVDLLPVRLALMGLLRLAELLMRERDCLVVSFRKP